MSVSLFVNMCVYKRERERERETERYGDLITRIEHLRESKDTAKWKRAKNACSVSKMCLCVCERMSERSNRPCLACHMYVRMGESPIASDPSQILSWVREDTNK